MNHTETALRQPMMLFMGVTIAGLLVIGSVVYSQVLLTSIYDSEGDLRSVSSDVQREVALAHLWLEEALTETDPESFKNDSASQEGFRARVKSSVRDPLHLALQKVEQQNRQLNPQSPIYDPVIARTVAELEQQLRSLIAIMEQRVANPESSGTGSQLDQELDRTFQELLESGRTLSTELREIIVGRRDFIGVVHLVIVLFIALLLFVVATLSLRSHEDMRQRNAKLEQRVRERTHDLAGKEAVLREVVDRAADPIVRLAADGEILAMNPAAEKLFRFAPPPLEQPATEGRGKGDSAIADRSLARVLPSLADRDDLEQQLREWAAESTPRQFYGQEFSARAHFHVSVNLCPLERGEARYLAIFHDISAQKATEATLREARDRARDLAHAKGAFMANLSHEIRTPLNAVLGIGDLLRRSLADADQRHMAELVCNSANSLLEILNNILEYSRLEAEKLKLQDESFDLVDCVDEWIEPLAFTAHQKGLQFNVSFGHGLPQRLVGDSVRIEQVLANLVGNAVKFTHSGSISIRVAPGTHNPVGDAGSAAAQKLNDEALMFPLRIEIEDTGVGIAASRVPEIFMPFSQIDASATRHAQGTGLGLSIAHQLATLMHGDLTVRSTPARGSCFTFTALLRVDDSAAAVSAVAPVARVLGSALIVDPEPTSRDELKRLLTTQGWGEVILRDSLHGVLDHGVLDGGVSGHGAKVQSAALTECDWVFIDARVLHAALESESWPWLVTSAVTDVPKSGSQDIGRSSAGRPRRPRIVVTLPTGWPQLPQFDAAEVDALLTKPYLRKNVRKISRVNAANRARRAHDTDSSSPVSGGSQGLTLLIAEDNGVNRELLRRFAQLLGWTTEFACDGVEALERARSAYFDLILMDCQMPRMDGYEAATRIRELPNFRGTPIIALTADATPEARDRALACGMIGPLLKPIELEHLERVVSSYCKEVLESARGEDNSEASGQRLDTYDWRRDSELQQVFQEETPPLLRSLRQAVQEQDIERMQAVAHRLKGSCVYVGLEEAASLAEQLERLDVEGLSHSVELVQDLDQVLARVLVAD